MRLWRNFLYSVILSSHYSPPRLVEAVMLLLAAGLCAVWWLNQQYWQYLVLCLSYIVGAIASILAREVVAPSSQTYTIRLTAVASLVVLVAVVGLYITRKINLV
ncbi:hypothetical protein [Pantanalinema sp. GBBB05]|uniref:hypothetical protein n=1 Tax=Pantanalinema sp. GBBB05 TaxID=2604139 RepID=UPI001D7955B0|nr:hypothetical protein [Pantanalinema sp. GBBB05]